MPKYIERDAFIEWLKKIQMVDLSDGRGLCRVIFEDDFKRAIKNMPESIIHDSEVEVVRCKDCKRCFSKRTVRKKQLMRFCMRMDGNEFQVNTNDFCSYGERREDGT